MRQLRYAGLNKKRRPAAGHSFARGFLPNGGHPLVLFRWTFWCVRDCSMLSRMPLLLQELSIRSCNSGSAGKNRKPPSATQSLPAKPQVAEVRNRGLVGRSRFSPHFRIWRLQLALYCLNRFKIMDKTANSVSIQKRRQGRNCSCRRWRVCL